MVDSHQRGVSERDSLHQTVRDAQHVHRVENLIAVVGLAAVVQSQLEKVLASLSARSQMQDLLELDAPRVPVLVDKEAAFSGLNPEPVGV